MLEIYDLKGELIGTQDRASFYREIKDEFAHTGRITRQVRRVTLLLKNTKGNIYLQKRSKSKSENSGLYDKTIGGHVKARNTFDMTMIQESAEELGFPAAVLPSEDYDQMLRNINLETIAILTQVEIHNNFQSRRVDRKGKIFVQPYISASYVGTYDGSLRFTDGESSGIEVFSLQELEKELEINAGRYTADLSFLVRRHKNFLSR